ncbi:hypothetical protein JKP88DRAFT_185555, partial [Tribonema minus]
MILRAVAAAALAVIVPLASAFLLPPSSSSGSTATQPQQPPSQLGDSSGATKAPAALSSRSGSHVLRMGEYMDEEAQRKLRDMLNKQFGKGAGTVKADEWAKPADAIGVGTVLLADPRPFFKGDAKTLQRFGLPEPIPQVISPDRQADLLPCILLVQHGPRGSIGVMLNRRTGMLMGDLGEDMSAFMIQPIFLGGTLGSQSLSFIHTYPEVAQAEQVTEDGLFFGGDFKSAVHCVREGIGSGFNFRFFVQYTQWGPGELGAEVNAGRWHAVSAGKMSLLRVRDRKGPDTAKPMWTDLLTMAGEEQPELKNVVDSVYGQ